MRYLVDVGLEYLTLERRSGTLSGGEAQRINLASCLGSSLVGTLYILDEPSIGLHARDIDRLTGILQNLVEIGNTVVVVEHDKDMIRQADHIIDLGPHAGERGGEVGFSGTLDELMKFPSSLTAQYLRGEKHVDGFGMQASYEDSAKPVKGNCFTWRTRAQSQKHHRKVSIESVVCVTGVSGSGKSTLVQDVLYPALRQDFGDWQSGRCS